MAVWKGSRSIGWLKSCTERVCIMNVRLVCVFASSSCIGTEPAAYVEENVESDVNLPIRGPDVVQKSEIGTIFGILQTPPPY